MIPALLEAGCKHFLVKNHTDLRSVQRALGSGYKNVEILIPAEPHIMSDFPNNAFDYCARSNIAPILFSPTHLKAVSYTHSDAADE